MNISIDLATGIDKTVLYVNRNTLTNAKDNEILPIVVTDTNIIDLYCRLINLNKNQTTIYKYILNNPYKDNLTINKIANAILDRCALSAIQARRVVESMIDLQILARREDRCVYITDAYNISKAITKDSKVIVIELIDNK